MEIHIDYNPTNHIPKNHFFISIKTKKDECLSFDNTIKGHRIIRQVLVKKKKFPKNKKATGKWKTLIIKNSKFIGEYPVKWIDLNEEDWLNNETWKTSWEKPISKELSKKLLFYSQLICDNYKRLDKFKKEVNDFETILKKEIKNLT